MFDSYFFGCIICPHVTSSETFAATVGTFLGSKVIGETPGLNVAANSGPNLRVSKQKVGEKNRIQWLFLIPLYRWSLDGGNSNIFLFSP